MRILYVAASPVPSHAANSIHVMKMAQAFAKNGHQITLIASEHGRKEEWLDTRDVYKFYGVERIFQFYRIPRFPIKRFRQLFYSFLAIAYAKINRCDLLYTRCFFTASMAGKYNIPFVFERHDLVRDNKEDLLKQTADSRTCKKIVVISETLKRAFIDNYGIEADKILVAADGADLLPYDLKPKLEPSQNLRAGYIGHLYEGRGIDIIGETARLSPGIDFHVVGGLPDDVSKWRQRFEDLNNITFHGHVAPSETSRYMLSFDALLAPYQKRVLVSGGSDTAKFMSPLKLFEYMSSNKPILCSDIQVLREVLTHQSNAYLCDPENPAEWSECLNHMKENPDEAKKIAAQALQDFIKLYTWQSRAKLILNQISY